MTEQQTVRNMLSRDVEIKGSIKYSSDLTIDGKVEAEITSSGSLTVGAHGEIRGEIKARSVTIFGKVQGNVTVTDRCELRGLAQLIGDLKAPRLVIEEGATFAGKSEVMPNSAGSWKPEVIEGKKKSAANVA